MELKMGSKLGAGESGIPLPQLSFFSSQTLSSVSTCSTDEGGGGGVGPKWRISFHFYRLNPNLTLFSISLLILLLFSSGICSVEGNGEIESCVRLMHSGLSPNSGVGASAVGHSFGGDPIRFGGSNANGGNNLGGSSSNTNSGGGNEHSVILCQIRTLHPDLDLENLTSSIPSGNGGIVDVSTITKLKIVCNDVLFFESGVRPGQLSSLSGLHELVIEKCKLKHLPADFLSGLRHLRKLTINTGNSEWAARSLEISPGFLSHTPQLRHFHVGFNHMWNLPEKLLCQVGSLQNLNLTSNLLSDIDDLGLPSSQSSGRVLPLLNEFSSSRTSTSSPVGDGCLGDLKYFDISFNSLRTLGSRRLEKMRRLFDLRVNHNWLEELEDDAFGGLGQLKKLNLSSNRLVALPAKLFQPCKLLQEIDLRNNSLSALAPGLLVGLEHLQILDLSMNSLSSSWITAEAFKSLVRLVILNLSNNQLVSISPSIFENLGSVQLLDLSNNLLKTIDDGTFSTMKNLHSLNLARNRLININANMFNGLFVLHKLIIDYNRIEKIEADSLRNCTSLQDLGLVGNQLRNVPDLRGLQLLKTLDLGENRISSLNNESFRGLRSMIGLRLVDNLVEEIPGGFCDSVPRLRVFNMAQNKIHKVSPSAFISCPELKVLRLDSNKLTEVPTLAPQLPNLLWLNVSENSIRFASYELLPPTLEWFDISHNQLESLGGAWTKNNANGSVGSGIDGQRSGVSHQLIQNQSPNQNIRLRIVDASHNQLSQLDYHAVPASIEVIRLSHNKLGKIAPDTFYFSHHLRRIELIQNQLESIPLNALRLHQMPAGRTVPEVLIGGNPFFCDCNMEWLTRINQLSALGGYPTVLDLDAIICRVSFSRTVTHLPIQEIKSQDFLCPYQGHCFALCHCCDFDACDCQMSCPSNCSCYHSDSWTANVVNCAGSGSNAIPSRLPMDSTEVYLDGNNILALKSHTFIGRKNLRVLFLNSSRIDTIANKSFNGLQSLQNLHLENNMLKALHGYEFDHLTRLRELYLHDNLIETISNTTFLQLKSLEILRLDGNRLQVFTVWQLSLNPYLVEIGLARNQWNCDCQFLHQLYGWVTDNSRKVVDLGQLQCVWNTTHKPGPHLIDYNRTCGSSWALMGIDGGFEYSPLPVIFAFIALVLLLIIIVIVLILCREHAQLFLFSHFGVRTFWCASEFDDEKLDAYLLYSQKDEEFVAQRIARELEENDSYRLCLHYRDLISETGDLKEMMVGAVENSKSVVIILSRNFLQGEWASGEYRAAFHSVLKKSQNKNSHEMKKVVIVFIDDIPAMDVSSDIRSWVRHNRIQVIKWKLSSLDEGKERKFWSKLKYSLPPPSSHYHSNITSNTTTATSASSGESTGGGIMATLKYSTNNEANEQHLIVDELTRTMTMNINNKLWPYATAGSNFVALPPKYQIPNSPGNHSQSNTHLSLNNYNNQSIHSQGSPSHHPNNHQTHHHYHPPPLPLSNPPKSPPSSQSTDSTTTTTGGDDVQQSVHTPTSFSLMFQQMQQQHNYNKSPLPVPKSLYSSANVSNNSVLNNSNNGSHSNSSAHGGGGGESYLSLQGEHIYATLDSPQSHSHQQTSHSHQNRIHLPNGYTYQPQMTMAPAQQQSHNSQWHPSSPKPPTPKGTLTFGSAKSFKQVKDGSNNPVQTYLV